MFDDGFDWPEEPEGYEEWLRRVRMRRHLRKQSSDQYLGKHGIILPPDFDFRFEYCEAVAGAVENLLDSEGVYFVTRNVEQDCYCLSFDIAIQGEEIKAQIVVEEPGSITIQFKPKAMEVAKYEAGLRSFFDDKNHYLRYGKFSVVPVDKNILFDRSVCIEYGFVTENFRKIWCELVISLLKLVEKYHVLSGSKKRNEEDKRIVSLRL